MALVDPYSLCPCGSGNKYKWCCQKVEAYAERAQRLVDNGQLESALKPLDEGLAKVPANPWLSTRKAFIHVQLNQPDAAKNILRESLRVHPENFLGGILLARLVLETEGPIAAVSQLQQMLSAHSDGDRLQLASLASVIGAGLAEGGFVAAAFKHLELGDRLAEGKLKQNASLVRNLKTNPAISAWEKQPYSLTPAPENAPAPFRESFAQALGWASEGLWSSAASAFELLAASAGAGALAERNRGLCLLWTADLPGAAAALRRYIARTGVSDESVDLEALCQRIDQPAPRDQVEFLHLTWPIRNKEGLLTALKGNKYFAEGPARPLDARDANSVEVARFFVLDRPQVEAKPGLSRQEIPLVLGEILITKDSVILETYDDGRLDRLTDRFTAAAGPNIPPSHPKTKMIGKEQRHLLTLSVYWQLPEGLDETEADRLNSEQLAHTIRDIWPDTPNPALRWRTPAQAAKVPDARVALRAAVLQYQTVDDPWTSLVDWDQFRSKLGLEPEPTAQPDQLDIEAVSLPRLGLLNIETLDDDRILSVYRRAREWGLRSVVQRSAKLIDSRPALLVKGNIEAVTLYGELSLDAASRGDREQATYWLNRGKDSESPRKRAANEISWEMIALQIEMALDEPEVWVKTLAVLLERYRGNSDATFAVLVRLINLGLVQVVHDPSRPEQMVLDTRTLEYYLERYGPKITTSSGELGVAAGQGEIWTPDSGRGGSGSPIWTPGSAAPPTAAEAKPKIILSGH